MSAFRQTSGLDGEIWETGVYQGGTARLFHELIAAQEKTETRLRLFDTFSGMPDAESALDGHQAGDIADTSIETVRRFVGDANFVEFHPGIVPDTFAGLENAVVKLAHVDLDLQIGITETCRFVYPRLVPGGAFVFDDYVFITCQGARAAVDDFFVELPEQPFVLPSGQALVVKLP